MSSKNLYLNILKHRFNDIYIAMKNTEHGYDGSHPNKYHLEGSILEHTEMVLGEVEARYNSDPELMLTALLHDIGKPSCAEDIHETKRRRFTNHAAISTFMAKPILEVFATQFVFNTEKVLKLISLHDRLYPYLTTEGIPNKYWKKIASMFQHDVHLFKKAIKFFECDHYGRIQEIPDNISNIIKDLDTIYRTLLVPSTLTLLIGPPRSGKSTWINSYNINDVIISRDSYVEKLGVGDTYSQKWNSLSSNAQSEIDKLIQKDFNEAIKANKNVVIDMTNMSKKSRRKWLADAKDYTKIARVFIEDTETLLSRNTLDKTISKEVIESMQKRFVIPTYEEFDIIEFNGV